MKPNFDVSLFLYGDFHSTDTTFYLTQKSHQKNLKLFPIQDANVDACVACSHTKDSIN